MNHFYVYEWYNVDTNVVFHVGKGTGNRMNEVGKNRRSAYFMRYYNKYNCKVRKVCENLEEQEALDEETRRIIYYRKNGEAMTNFLIDGVLNFGFKHSDETKEKISNSLKKRKLTEEHKQKISKSHIGKKMSTATKEKISIAKKGSNNWMYGKKRGAEYSEKMSKIKGQNLFIMYNDEKICFESTKIASKWILENKLSNAKIDTIRRNISRSIQENGKAYGITFYKD